MSEPIRTMPFTLTRAFYGVWAAYWLKHGDKIPPIYGYKSSMNHGITVVVPMGPPDVEPFVREMEDHPTWVVESQGASLLDEVVFVGHWAAISISLLEEKNPVLIAPKLKDLKKRFLP